MKSRPKITPIIAGLVAATALLPASAQASSVLSGYGGPGQGNQVILGASLLNGPRGGSGGGSGGGSSSSSTLPNLDASTTGTNEGSPQGSSHAPTRARHPAGGTAGSKARTDVNASNRSIGGVGSYTLAQRAEAAHSGFGLSGAAVVYAVLALAALVLAGVLTRRLARTEPANRHG
jgi:hypothetical protein